MNNKNRANTWERQASKLLSLWISGGTRKNLFWRTASSGAKGSVTKEANHCGDITAVDPAGAEFCKEYYIECKWRREFDYSDLGAIKKWITVEGTKARELGKALLMLIKGRNGEVYVLVNVAKRSALRLDDIPVSDLEYLVYQGYAISRIVRTAKAGD